MRVLLPWKTTPEVPNGYVRFQVAQFGSHMCYSNVYCVGSLWKGCFWPIAGGLSVAVPLHDSKEIVMAAVDKALIEDGWKLLNDGDPLILLI